jgi:hypothetical protein
MEILFIIGLLALLYLAPEIWRSKQRTEYKYPDIPEKPATQPELSIKRLPHIPPALDKPEAHHLVQKSAAMPPEVEVPNFIEERPLGGNSAWVNGIIMAEILQPPRAKRPLCNHKKI